MPFTKKREKSPSSTPIPSTEAAAGTEAPGAVKDGSHLPDKQWEAMRKVLDYIYDYRAADGWDPSKLFHRKVNKRVIPEYYETIKEPIALSTVKQKVQRKEYQNFSEYVRDFALIPHNAQVFNRADSGAFQDALVIKQQLEEQLQKLVDQGVISKEVATLPYLGEIPTYEEAPVEEAAPAEDEESSEDDEGEEDEDEEELDDEGRPKKKRKGPRGASSIAKRAAADGDHTEKKARGRPPKLLTPMESRILAIIKGIRKPKNQRGALMIKDFDRLPDKQAMPEYYAEVKNPMAYDMLKKKVKRKKYRSVEEFMADVNLMFNNAKSYNTDDSTIYKHATQLQIEAGKLYDIERAKPDDTFADEEGKLPLPNGILQNGELYKVGDWVHIQNPNDLTKPIPAQIYRTYKDSNGRSLVNVCWYYRPEQTVHRFDKHFLPNEVVKTGRYRDHAIEEVEGKCFIMFFTRYFKGRPRGLPEGMEIYVCEARYNEAKHEFNKIKTWASCLPDEVRDRDYEMDLFDHPRKMKKYPSPIAYLLKDEQKETGDFPKVTWGAEGAPPKIGAVHKRPRNERDSLPPEPTPPPPPKMPTPPPRQVAPSHPQLQQHHSYGTPMQPTQTPRPQPMLQQPIARPPSTQGYGAAHPQQYAQQPHHAAPSPAPSQRPPSAIGQHTGYGGLPQTPQQVPATVPRPAMPTTQSYHQPNVAATPSIPPNPSTYAPRPGIGGTAGNYRDPPPIEVYVLPDQANLSIPLEVREQYQKDEYGRVLFFTAPPVAVNDGKEDGVRGHSVRYLAEKARRKAELGEKRKVREEEVQQRDRVAKKAKIEQSVQAAEGIEELKRRALASLEAQMNEAVTGELGEDELRRLEQVQGVTRERERLMEEHARMRRAVRGIRLDGSGLFGDDWDSRVVG